MPHTKSTKKRVKTNDVRRNRNVARRSKMRHVVRDLRNNIAEGTGADVIAAKLVKAVSLLDKMVNQGLIHRNKAARMKSRLTTQSQAQA